MRHFGEHDNRQVAVIGHNPAHDKVMFAYFDSLQADDASWLSKVLASPNAQKAKYAAQILQIVKHEFSGRSGFDYLMQLGVLKTLSPYEVKLYSIDQSNDWFKGPSAYISPAERRAPQVVPMDPDAPLPVRAERPLPPVLEDVNKIAPPIPLPTVQFDIPNNPRPLTDSFVRDEGVTNPSIAQELRSDPIPSSGSALERSIERLVSVIDKAADRLSRTLDLDARLAAFERKQKREQAEAQKKRDREAAKRAEKVQTPMDTQAA